MKRKSLINRIISLSIVAVLYLSTSASAFAEIDGEEAPVVETQESSQEDAISDSPAAEVVPEAPATGDGEAANNESPKSESPLEEIIDAVKDILIDDPQVPEAGPKAPGEAGEEAGEYKEDGDGEGEDEELDEEELDGEELEEELEEECEHEFIYESNQDGTHTVKCSKCDMEEYVETCEHDDNGVCIHCGYKRLPDPVLVYEDEDVVVRVAGAVPENADLRVKPIKKEAEETEAAYNEIEQKLIDTTDFSHFEKIGFVAYDICFVNIETSEEIEPDGDVTVTLEYKNGINPIEGLADTDTESVDVSVIHVNEESAELENLTEAGRASLDLEGDNTLTRAEFTSDTFSTYIFKYTASGNKTIKVIFNNLDKNEENITTISTTSKNHNISSRSQVDQVTNFADEIEGYRFLKAQYTFKDTDGTTETVEFDNFRYEYTNYTPYLKFYKGDNQVGGTRKLKIDGQEIFVDMIYERDLDLSITKKVTGPAADDAVTVYKIKLEKAGQPVSGVRYKIGSTSYQTGDDGIISLKAGEVADFATIEPGDYKVTEVAIDSTTLGFSDFKTKIFDSTNQIAEYQTESTLPREGQFTVVEGVHSDIIIKNYYYRQTTVNSNQEILAKYIRYYPTTDHYQLQVKFTGPDKLIEEVTYEQESQTVITDREVNIVIIIDRSGSMARNSRITHVRDAVKLISEVFQTKRHVDAKWKIVDFASNATLNSQTQNWVDSAKLYQIASGNFTNTSGGTNYEGALLEAKNQLDTASPSAEKYVLFLTDGEPTNYNGGGYGNKFDATGYKKALAAAAQITCDAFYAIGVDFGNGNYNVDGQNYTAKAILTNVANAVNSQSITTSTVSSDEIVSLFNNIAGKISDSTTGGQIINETTYGATNVVITDPLSDYVDIKKGSGFYLAIKKNDVDELANNNWGAYRNGTIGSDGTATKDAEYDIYKPGTTEVEATITATYDSENRAMVMTFPADYQLPSNYSFAMVFEVEASDLAYETYNPETNTGYTAVGDPFTDHGDVPEAQRTSAGKDGFPSNKDAIVTYNYLGNSEKQYFPHPVVQVHYKNDWEIYKITDSDNPVPLAGAEFTLEEKGNTNVLFTGSSDLKENAEGIVTWTLDNSKILPGKTYILRETSAPYGYLRNPEYWEIKLSDDNVPTVTRYDEMDTKIGEYTVEPVLKRDVYIYKLYYKDLTLSALPETGGTGTGRYRMIGMMLVLSGAVLMYVRRRRTRA